MLGRFLILLAVICCTSPLAHAATVTLAWDANAEADLAGYKLYYGNAPRSQATYPNAVTIGNRGATSHTITLEPGTYYFSLTAYNSSGQESGFSNEVTREIPGFEPPGKPGQPRLVP